LVLLIDDESASASEVMQALWQDYDRAHHYWQTFFGKGLGSTNIN